MLNRHFTFLERFKRWGARNKFTGRTHYTFFTKYGALNWLSKDEWLPGGDVRIPRNEFNTLERMR